MRRSTVLSLPPQLVFPAHSFVNHREGYQSGLEIQHKNRCITLIAQKVYKKLLIISQELLQPYMVEYHVRYLSTLLYKWIQ
jgi:hypothetical protein